MQNIIDDGYTQEGYISPENGLYDSLEFTYRPMTSGQRDEVDSIVMSGRNPKEGSRKVAQAIAFHVKTWSEKSPITVDVASRLRPSLSDKLYSIVSGRRPSDAKPDTGPESDRSYLDAGLEAGGKN